jgi:hypothetical protein
MVEVASPSHVTNGVALKPKQLPVNWLLQTERLYKAEVAVMKLLSEARITPWSDPW